MTFWSLKTGLSSDQFFLLARLVFHDVSRNRAGCNRERGGQVHLSGPASAGEIPVLCADHHLVGARRNSRAGVDARSATGLDHLRTRLLENVNVAFAQAIFPGLLRSELNVKLHRLSHLLPLLERI